MRRVHVIGTGGSISFVGSSRTDLRNYGSTGQKLDAASLYARIPEANELAHLTFEDYADKPSHQLGPSDWLAISRRVMSAARAGAADGFVVTHGTMTTEELSFFLHLTARVSQPIVVIAAFRPPSALSTDADLNLLQGVQVAASDEVQGAGVLVVSDGTIYSARDVEKVAGTKFAATRYGPLGYVDEGRVLCGHRVLKRHTMDSRFDAETIGTLPRVDVVPFYGGTDEALVNASVAAGAAGLVVEGLARPDRVAGLAEKGIVIAKLTPPSRAIQAAKILWAPVGSLRKARVLLACALTRSKDPQVIQELLLEH